MRRSILPPSYERSLGHAERIELASDRPIRERNKVSYRFAHWPIWIFVFFIAPGPLTFDLFERGFDSRDGAVARRRARGHRHRRSSRAAAGRRAATVHHPLHRRSSEPVSTAASATRGVERSHRLRAPEHHRPGGGDCDRDWRLRQMYDVAYFPIVVTIWLLGAFGQLPRVKASTQNEGHERRYFYGSVWAVCIAQPVLWFLWKSPPSFHGSTCSSSRCSSGSLPTSATWPAVVCSRGHGRLCRVNCGLTDYGSS